LTPKIKGVSVDFLDFYRNCNSKFLIGPDGNKNKAGMQNGMHSGPELDKTKKSSKSLT